MAKFGAGQSVRRVEDQRFVTGSGRYTDDIDVAGQVYGYVLRSPEAHARIGAIDAAAAKAAPGVLAVITGADLVASGAGNGLPCLVPMENRDGSEGIHKERPILCVDHVRHVGDPVAFVVAKTLAEARDAAEQIVVDYESLPAAIETATAADDGQPLVHDDVPHNLAFDWEYGERAAVEDALARAARVVELRIVNNRLISNAMEPRAGIAQYDQGKYTLQACSQGVWLLRDPIAGAILKTEPENLRVLTADVGGGFGTKAFPYPEYGMLLVAAKQLGRPVKWTGERTETFVSDVMGRDHVTTAGSRWTPITGSSAWRSRPPPTSALTPRSSAPSSRPWRRSRSCPGCTTSGTWSTGSRACSPTPRRSTPTAAPGGPNRSI